MSPPSKEARVILALEALQNDKNPKLKAIARLYNVPASTLRRRRAGVTNLSDPYSERVQRRCVTNRPVQPL